MKRPVWNKPREAAPARRSEPVISRPPAPRRDFIGEDDVVKPRRDFIGEAERTRPRRTPTPEPTVSKREQQSSDLEDITLFRNPSMFDRGVSMLTLTRIFKLSRHHVQQRMSGIAPMSVNSDTPLYNFLEAANRLIDGDRATIIASAKPDELPQRSQREYWGAQRDKQNWQQKAGLLWESQEVLDKFQEILIGIRTKLLLTPDRVERITGLNIDQYKLIKTCIDEILEDIADEILKMAKEMDDVMTQLERDKENHGEL